MVRESGNGVKELVRESGNGVKEFLRGGFGGGYNILKEDFANGLVEEYEFIIDSTVDGGGSGIGA